MIIIAGATSGIARALIRRLAHEKHGLILLGRDRSELERIAKDTHIRYRVPVMIARYDAMRIEDHEALMMRIHEKHPTTKGMIILQGHMDSEDHPGLDAARTARIHTVNGLGAITLIQAYRKANPTAEFVAAVTSIAGERGKPRNLIYNSAKASLQVYLAGLKASVKTRIIDIRPGFVDTQMTYGKRFPLTASRERVADDITRSLTRRGIVYTPFYWRYIMLILRSLPESVFRRL